jgi:hypothetical protein
MKRLHVNFPYNYGNIEIINGSLRETKIMYYLHAILDGGNRDEILEYMNAPFGSFLHGFLMAIGPYSRLWLGDLDGVITPKDVQPEGWTYPSGKPIEDSWFWEWHPSEFSQSQLLEDVSKINPFGDQGRLKSLVPMKLNDKYGEIKCVEAIPVMRLPQLFRKCDWMFEVD